MMMSEFIVLGLLFLALGLSYLIQEKKLRAGVGLVAFFLAVVAVLRRKPKPAATAESVIAPDTREKKREEQRQDLETLDAEIASASPDTDPDVSALSARLDARRKGLHNPESD